MEEEQIPDLVSCSSDEDAAFEEAIGKSGCKEAKPSSARNLAQRRSSPCLAARDATPDPSSSGCQVRSESTATESNDLTVVETDGNKEVATQTVGQFASETAVRKQCKVQPEKSFLKCVREGSAAFLARQYDKAVPLFNKALAHGDRPTTSTKQDNASLKYALACALLETGGYDSLVQSIATFEEIAADTFPPAYYGLGRCYTKLNRFKKALEVLYRGKEAMNDETALKVFDWPESSVVVEESNPKKLKMKIEELIVFCQKPPRPDAVCCYEQCENPIKKEIYYTDPDFKGLVQVACNEHCGLFYHVACWKCQREESHKNTDKDFLGSKCLTPDCGGSLIKVVYVNNKGIESKKFVHPLKIDESGKPKPKKTKIDKKPGKKKKKKLGATASQGTLHEDKAATGDGDTHPENSPVLPRNPTAPHRPSESPTPRQESPALNRRKPLLGTSAKNVVNPTKVNLEHMLVLKKTNDEAAQFESWQKIDRHRDKKKEKKKNVKTVPVERFIGTRQEEFGFTDHDYMDRLSHLEQYWTHQATEIGVGDHALKIQRSLKEFLSINGPVNVESPQLLHALGRMSEACQEVVLVAGGIRNFLSKCNAFALIDGRVYLTGEALTPHMDLKLPNLVTPLMDLKFPNLTPLMDLKFPNLVAANSAVSSLSEGVADRRLDVLDDFEAISDDDDDVGPEFRYSPSRDDDDEGTAMDPSIAPVVPPPPLAEENDVAEEICDNVDPIVSGGALPLRVPNSPCSTPTGFADSACQLDAPDAALPPRSQPRKNLTHLKYYDVFKRFLRFIPSFSENAQKSILHHLLSVVVQEGVLQRYKTEHNLNIDVEDLESSFSHIAQALNARSDQQTQTEFCDFDEDPRLELQRVNEEKVRLQAHLFESVMTIEKMRELQVRSQAMRDCWKPDCGVAPQPTNPAVGNDLARCESENGKMEEGQRATAHAGPSSIDDASCEARSGNDDEQNGLRKNPNSKSLVTILSIPRAAAMASQGATCADFAAVAVEATKTESNGARRKLLDAIESVNSQVPLPCPPSSTAGKMEPVALDSARKPTPPRNCFERVMGQLRAKFPACSRDELSEFVQQLRTNRNNTLTGLTMDAIVLEVSKLVGDEKNQSFRRRSVHNVTFKNLAPSTYQNALPSRMSDVDMVWSKAGSEAVEWNFKACDDSDMCVICHDEMTSDVHVLQCHHRFHNQCIRDWFQHQNTCPVCRVLSLPPDEFPTLS